MRVDAELDDITGGRVVNAQVHTAPNLRPDPHVAMLVVPVADTFQFPGRVIGNGAWQGTCWMWRGHVAVPFPVG